MPVSSVCEWVQSYRKLTTPHDATLDVSSTCAVVWGPAAPHAVVNTRASAARPCPTQPTASARSSHRAGWWSQRGPCRSCFLGRLGRRWLSSWLRSAARPPPPPGLPAYDELGQPVAGGGWYSDGGSGAGGCRDVVPIRCWRGGAGWCGTWATAWLMVVASVGVLSWRQRPLNRGNR